MSDKLSEVFDITPMAVEKLPVPYGGSENVSTDAEIARANLKQLMETAKTALQYALSTAVQSESPRAFEVLANLINTAADLNNRLMEVHTTEQKMVKAKPDEPSGNVTNNVIFAGTTNELNALIMKRITQNANE